MKKLKKYWEIAPVSIIITGICILVTIAIHTLPILYSSIERAILLGAFYKPFILVGEWWRIITVGFVHIDIFHLLLNLSFLLQAGFFMEHFLGTKKYLILLFGSIAGGSLLQLIYAGNIVSVGISGGLFGIFAAELFIIYYSGAIYSPSVRNNVIRTVAILILMQFLRNIAVMAHIGGFVAGFFLIIIIYPDCRLKQLRLHTLISFLLLLLFCGYMVQKNRYIPKDEIYLGTDTRILLAEYELGFESYSQHMSEKLAELYMNAKGE